VYALCIHGVAVLESIERRTETNEENQPKETPTDQYPTTLKQ